MRILRRGATVTTASPLPPSSTNPNYRQEAIETFYRGIKDAGINFVVFFPDSVLDGIARHIQRQGDIPIYQCSREDEGVAMAVGAYMVGKVPLVMMEGSGIGLSGLILARAVVQRTPTLLLVSHNLTLGERFDYHAATRMAAQPMFQAFQVPHYVLSTEAEVPHVLLQARYTMEGQRTPVALMVPPYIVRGG